MLALEDRLSLEESMRSQLNMWAGTTNDEFNTESGPFSDWCSQATPVKKFQYMLFIYSETFLRYFKKKASEQV